MERLRELIGSLRVAAVTDPEGAAALDAHAREEWAYAAGLQIWVFGLPLMRTELIRRGSARLKEPMETLPFAPINQLGHMRALPTAESDLPFTPNVDTLYSGAIIELADGPLIFKAPAIADRYWSLEIADAYLSNLPYLGTRTTGQAAGVWLLAAPSWDGEVPPGVELYPCPTVTIVLALRIRAEGTEEVQNLAAIQDRFCLTPLKNYLAGSEEPAEPRRTPEVPRESHDLAYFTTLCRLLKRNPPYERDASIKALMEVIGLPPGADVDPDRIDPAVRRGLVRAASEAPNIISWKVKYRGNKNAAMWNVDLTGGTYGTDYLARAEGCIQGLFVHDPIECTYFHTYHDGAGNPLNGSNSYALRFGPDQIARTGELGFWSITGYGTRFTLIPNEPHRYAVQSSDPNLMRDPDGGITIIVGPHAPEGHLSNWVATEPGQPFRLNYRVYLPDPEMIDARRVDHFLPPVLPA